jgi:hypothetical protein
LHLAQPRAGRGRANVQRRVQLFSRTGPRGVELRTQGALALEEECVPVPSGVARAFPEELLADVREHSWGDDTGVRCARARSRKVSVLEAAAQVSPRRLVAPSAAACVACVLAAAAAPAPAFACAVFLAACVLGDAVVDEGGEGGCCSCQEGNRRQICPSALPLPAHSYGEGYAVSYDACGASVVFADGLRHPLSPPPSRVRSGAPRRSVWRVAVDI